MDQKQLFREIKRDDGRILSEYLSNPCKTLSLPYWKAKDFVVPDGVTVVHDDDYCGNDGRLDTRYFRIKHDMSDIKAAYHADFTVKTAELSDIPQIVRIINGSYSDISVDVEQMTGYTKTAAFDKELWIIACDAVSGNAAGCGIAELDREANEGVLEWIQVLPEFQGKGIGQLIVFELLFRLKDRAAFVTVSGKADSEHKPERLYRKCGFTGKDIWHVLLADARSVQDSKG